MNQEVANRLQQLRKAKGLSQEELANILGLSRQAISKWERAETSPDTDNLICLARLYNISIDKLLDTSESTEEIKERIAQERIAEINNSEKIDAIDIEDKKETIEEVEAVIIEDKVELTEKEKELKKKRDELATNLETGFIVFGLTVYFIAAIIRDDWSWGWQFIFVGMFGGLFMTQLFINRTFSGVSLMIAIGFTFWALYMPMENDENTKLIIGWSFSGAAFLGSQIPIISFVRFNLKNRKEITLLNEKDELIRLQDKCKKIIEANENYKKEINDINK